MIARILLAVSLVLLVAAPAPALAGSMHFEQVEEAGSLVDDEATEQVVPAYAVARPPAARPPRSEAAAPTGPALDRIFRPPRPTPARAPKS